VSNAGGLGVIAAHNAGTPANLVQWIQQVRALAPGKPFGVNFTILPAMGEPPPYDEYAAVVIAQGVQVVETAGSNPKKWISLFKGAGLVTIHKCVTVRHALAAEKLGVDIVSLDGFECAGHPGEADVGNFVLQASAEHKQSKSVNRQVIFILFNMYIFSRPHKTRNTSRRARGSGMRRWVLYPPELVWGPGYRRHGGDAFCVLWSALGWRPDLHRRRAPKCSGCRSCAAAAWATGGSSPRRSRSARTA
jgi:hypothetical protein